MAVPSSGPLSLFDIAKEVDNAGGYGGTIIPSTFRTYYADPISLGNMSTGSGGFDAINQFSVNKPDGNQPHAMSEFYGYNASATGVSLTGAYAITTANTSGDTMVFSKGVNGVQTASTTNTNASTYQQISASNTIGYGVDQTSSNYYKVQRSGIVYQSATLSIYLTAPSGWEFSNHSVSSYNCSATSITQSGTNFSFTANQSSSTVDTMYATLTFSLTRPWSVVNMYYALNSTYGWDENDYGDAYLAFPSSYTYSQYRINAPDLSEATLVEWWNGSSYVTASASWLVHPQGTDPDIFRYWDGSAFPY